MAHAANALAALNLSAHSMDAQALMMQSGLLSPSQGADFTQALLSQLPSPPGLLPPGLSPDTSSPQQQLLHASSVSSPLQHFDMGHDQHGPRVFVPDSLKGAGNLPASSSPTQAQFLQQAALGQQQQLDQASMVQSLLQNPLLLQQVLQQQAAVDAFSAAAGMPPGLGQQPLSALNNWGQGMQPFNLAEAAAAAAAAAAMMVTQQHQQQQQQQVQAAVFKALAMLGSANATPAQGGFATPAPPQVESWAANALARQQQAAGYSPGLVNPHQLASLLNSSSTGAAAIPRASSLGAHGRRRSARRSSGTTATAVAGFATFSGTVSRANSTAGSEAGADGKGGLPAVLPAGITHKDLCPNKYEDTWAEAGEETPAAATPAGSVSSDGSCQLVRGSSSASTSSIESNMSAGAASVSGSALSLSSSASTNRAGSGPDAEDRWEWDSHFCSLDEDTASRGSSGLSGRACRKAAAAAAKQQGAAAAAAPDADTTPSKDQTPAASKAAAGKAAAAAGVWIPGQLEAAGDDSWYLPRPPTCRLFVGNIGCWVDESMLLGYFGKYGNVVDVQVRSSSSVERF
jgi:hypothetical protein